MKFCFRSRLWFRLEAVVPSVPAGAHILAVHAQSRTETAGRNRTLPVPNSEAAAVVCTACRTQSNTSASNTKFTAELLKAMVYMYRQRQGQRWLIAVRI